MQRVALPCFVFAALVLVVACPETPAPDPYQPIPLTRGLPRAGVHTTFLELPAGVPLGAYTARDVNLGLGGASATQPEDRRNSPWSHKFFPSIGYATGIALDALWLTNGDRHLVLLTADLGAAYDGLVFATEQAIEDATGIDVRGQVILATNHSHSAPAGHHGSMHFAPGFDRFDPRVAQRLVAQFTRAALAAYDDLEEVRIGVGVLEDFDPIGTDDIFRDRRGENDALPDHAGRATGEGFKDPRAHLLKVERLDGSLKAAGLHFGIHGTLFDAENHWAHWDAAGAVKHGVKAALGGLPILFLQGFAGDISPVGRGPALASADRLARVAAPRVVAALEQVQTSAEAFYLDAATITVPQSLEDVKVTRRGTAHFRYDSFRYDWENRPDRLPDNQIYDESGAVIELIDEFPAPTGGGLCTAGTGDALVALGFGIDGTEVAPYQSCVMVDRFGALMTELYEMNWAAIFESTEEGPRTIEPGMRSTTLSFAKLEGVPLTRIAEGASTVTASARVALWALPGEPCTLFGLRAESYLLDLGYDAALIVGYAQDHEGYLMTIEDWLAGGYEPGINIWGPLQAEYLLESSLPLAERALLAERIRTDDLDTGMKTNLVPVGFDALPETRHVTPGAGEAITDPLPNDQWLVLPVGYPRDAFDPLSPPEEVEAYRGIYAAAFEGGDVSVDSPRVELQREVAGDFVAVDLGDGAGATHFGPGIFLSYTPVPHKPVDAWVPRRHLWVVSWQPLGESVTPGGWADVPLGRYRFVVRGQAIRSEGAAPEAYELSLAPFAVVATTLEVEAREGALRLTYPRAPQGKRLRGVEGDPQAPTPLPAGTVVTLACGDAPTETRNVDGVGQIALPDAPPPCTLRDAHGHEGRWPAP